MSLTLRPYQQAGITALYNYLRQKFGNPCLVYPTGAGKSACIAQACYDAAVRWNGRVIVLTHVKELIEQLAAHLASFLPINMVGLHSAGIGRRDTQHPVIVAGIQTVYNKACELGAFNLIIVDECHLIPESGEGRYLTFLRDAKIVNPDVRLIGFTATPYRLGSGMLCKPDNMLTEVCYEADVKELIMDGWLCRLRTRRGMECANLDDVKVVSTGDFASDEMQNAFEVIIRPACKEITALCSDRQSVLIFAAGIEHARIVSETLGGELVTGSTPKEERAAIIARFKAGATKYLVNVNVLTTGFDAPNVDAVVLLRATMSPGLYYQMVGRGLRKHPSKADCLVLDYGDNAIRHGPIDKIEVRDKKKKRQEDGSPAKECPNCHDVIAVQYRICPICEYEFPSNFTTRHGDRAGDAPVLSEEIQLEELPVCRVDYSEHVKQKEDGPSVTLRVEYVLNEFTGKSVNQFVCFNHPPGSFARRKAEQWWCERSNAPMPDTVMDALAWIKKKAVADPLTITISKQPGRKYPEIIGWDLAPTPDGDWEVELDDDFFSAEPFGVIDDPNDIPF